MACVYILYSKLLNKHYIGSCLNLEERLEEHKTKIFNDGFTAITNDWELIFTIKELQYKQARKIEAYIKRMKSKKYIENLYKYGDLVKKLVDKYKQV